MSFKKKFFNFLFNLSSILQFIQISSDLSLTQILINHDTRACHDSMLCLINYTESHNNSITTASGTYSTTASKTREESYVKERSKCDSEEIQIMNSTGHGNIYVLTNKITRKALLCFHSSPQYHIPIIKPVVITYVIAS